MPVTESQLQFWGLLTMSVAADHWLISGLFLLLGLASYRDMRRDRPTSPPHEEREDG